MTTTKEPTHGPGLKLTRKVGESIVINGPCEIIVTDLTPSRCAVRVVAPDGVKIFRKELLTDEDIDRHKRGDSIPSEA